MDLEKGLFGVYNGLEVTEYTLKNNNGMEIKILSLGAIIREIIYEDKNRVLGFDNLDSYVNSSTYMGALVGRVAGRISKGKIEINKTTYELDKNEGTTCLHGGNEGFSVKLWELDKENITEDTVGITLKYMSKDLECGFPGDMIIFVRYTLKNDDTLTIEYFAETNKDTIITLTNHSYFNLNDDHSNNILNHELMIDANEYIEINESNIPINISDVENTPFDFRSRKKIDKAMDLTHYQLINSEGFDHPFILKKNSKIPIILSSKKSGIQLSIETTEPVVILYCSNKIREDLPLLDGTKTFKYQGVCLETQWYPDAINQDYLPKNILKPGQEYYSMTKYMFSVINPNTN
ncbi:MAG: aldose epimerase family protein [Tissierellaceae bacterium]|nr:aldose epimerase family protein [Tissierellaceae bacterium]